ncbi:UDP-glycosyltransferase 75C1-like [Cornus florida]|uniref:UDP-glycosyltransferase 75C1-like n=1 Tax=Cornus florida TaxID=4283 RepID=UPI0028A16455|nr:UDP-glycosyltransferase 75C1-like [Cornus florida]
MVDCHILLGGLPHSSPNFSVARCHQSVKNLVQMGVKVTIIISLSAHCRMTKSNSTIPNGLSLSAFSGGYDDGFKEGDNHEHFLSQFKIRSSNAMAELNKAGDEGGYTVTCLVHTMAQPWVPEVAHAHHIPSALLWTQPATVFDNFHYYLNGYGDAIRKIVNDPSSSIQLPWLPLLPSRDLPSFLLPPHRQIRHS